VGLDRSIRHHPVRALPLTEKLAGSRIQSLAQGFKILRLYFAGKSEQFRSSSLPAA
jgi:hypothetical protein